MKTFPQSLGYSCVGRVINIGKAVNGISPGDLIWIDRPHQEEHIVSEIEALAGVCRKTVDPRRYTFRVLAKVALAGVHDAHPYLGSTAAVIGLGVIGQITVDLLSRCGVTRIFCVDPNRFRHTYITASGAHSVAVDGDAAMIIKQDLEGGADIAIEASGCYAGLAAAIRSVGVGGRVVSVSTYSGSPTPLNLGEEYHRNRIELLSSMSVNDCPHRGYPAWTIPRQFATARTLLDDGVIMPERLISHVSPFDKLPDCYERLLAVGADEMAILVSYGEAAL